MYITLPVVAHGHVSNALDQHGRRTDGGIRRSREVNRHDGEPHPTVADPDQPQIWRFVAVDELEQLIVRGTEQPDS